jgi:Rrf2 family protein
MQRITQWGEYGVHVCLYIARRQAEGLTIVGASDISDAQSLALNYTQQILVKLRAGGIVESERGPHGGYRLSRDPSLINLKDILLSCEGETMDMICDTKPIDSEKCSVEAKCYLRTVWSGLKESIDTYLESFTLAKLLEQMKYMDAPLLVSLPSHLHGSERKSS